MGGIREDTDSATSATRVWRSQDAFRAGRGIEAGGCHATRHSQQQAFSGYISNGATWIAPVTFSDGLTRYALHATEGGEFGNFTQENRKLHAKKEGESSRTLPPALLS